MKYYIYLNHWLKWCEKTSLAVFFGNSLGTPSNTSYCQDQKTIWRGSQKYWSSMLHPLRPRLLELLKNPLSECNWNIWKICSLRVSLLLRYRIRTFLYWRNGCMCFAFLVTRTVEATSAGRKIDLFLRHFNNSSLVFSVFCMIESNSKSKNWQFYGKIHFWP